MSGAGGGAPRGLKKWEGMADIQVRVGCNIALCPSGGVCPPAALCRAEARPSAPQGSTFSEAVFWILDILSEVRNLLQEVRSVGHVCCAPFRVAVLVCLWAGPWGRVCRA